MIVRISRVDHRRPEEQYHLKFAASFSGRVLKAEDVINNKGAAGTAGDPSLVGLIPNNNEAVINHQVNWCKNKYASAERQSSKLMQPTARQTGSNSLKYLQDLSSHINECIYHLMTEPLSSHTGCSGTAA